METIILIVAAVMGPLVLTFGVLVVVFRSIGRTIDQEAEGLAGVELDSGRTKVTARYEMLRTAKLLRNGLRKNPGRVVLTGTQLRVIERPQRYGIFERGDLGRFTVDAVDGSVVLRSDDPPGATGAIQYEFAVADPAGWVDALRRAGARSPA